MKKSALALAAVLVLALTVFVSAGSAADVYGHSPKVDVYGHTVNVHPDPFQATGFSSGPGQDVRSTAPDQDVRSTAPDQDVRGHAAPKAIKLWASKAWSSKGW
jgi:hypothetical protein